MPDGTFNEFPIPFKTTDNPADKANKTTTINGKSLEADRVIYAQDIPSKNLLPNTASTQTINGVTFTVNADGSISTSGTASSGILFTIGSLTLKSGIQYAFSGCPSGGDLGSYFINFSGVVNDTGNGATATQASNVTTNAVINIVSGTNMNGKTFRPMIRLASIEDDSYVPYSKTAVELTQIVGGLSTPSITFTTGTNVSLRSSDIRKWGAIVEIDLYFDVSANLSNNAIVVTASNALPKPALNYGIGIGKSVAGNIAELSLERNSALTEIKAWGTIPAGTYYYVSILYLTEA